MTTGSLLVADLVIAVLASAAWLAGGAASAVRRRPLALDLAAVALLATLARTTTFTALPRAGWWFAAEKVLIAAPYCRLWRWASPVRGCCGPRATSWAVAVPRPFAR